MKESLCKAVNATNWLLAVVCVLLAAGSLTLFILNSQKIAQTQRAAANVPTGRVAGQVLQRIAVRMDQDKNREPRLQEILDKHQLSINRNEGAPNAQ